MPYHTHILDYTITHFHHTTATENTKTGLHLKGSIKDCKIGRQYSGLKEQLL